MHFILKRYIMQDLLSAACKYRKGAVSNNNMGSMSVKPLSHFYNLYIVFICITVLFSCWVSSFNRRCHQLGCIIPAVFFATTFSNHSLWQVGTWLSLVSNTFTSARWQCIYPTFWLHFCTVRGSEEVLHIYVCALHSNLILTPLGTFSLCNVHRAMSSLQVVWYWHSRFYTAGVQTQVCFYLTPKGTVCAGWDAKESDYTWTSNKLLMKLLFTFCSTISSISYTQHHRGTPKVTWIGRLSY